MRSCHGYLYNQQQTKGDNEECGTRQALRLRRLLFCPPHMHAREFQRKAASSAFPTTSMSAAECPADVQQRRLGGPEDAAPVHCRCWTYEFGELETTRGRAEMAATLRKHS